MGWDAPEDYAPEGNAPEEGDKAEAQFQMAVYDDGKSKGLFRDYAEMVQQFGFASLFVTCFPLAPSLAVANNYLEIRIDGVKLCQGTRRPEPKGAEDIGTWYIIMDVMSTVAVITNSMIICFTSKRLTGGLSPYARLVLFIVLEHLILMTKYVYGLLSPDVEYYVKVQESRQEFLVDKVVDKAADDDDQELIFQTLDREDGLGFGDNDVCTGEDEANFKAVIKRFEQE